MTPNCARRNGPATRLSPRRDPYDDGVRLLSRLPRPAAAALLAGVSALIAGCGLQQGLDQRGDAAGVNPTRAPSIAGPTIAGASFSWAAAHGHPVVVDFWASWCGPCRAEQADINRLVATYAPKGVVFIGVDMRDDAAAALAYRHDLGVTYDSVPDASEQISAAYDVSAPPTLVLVGPGGAIVDRFLGTVVGLSDDLNRLL